jgi:hypothetical protein
VTEDLHVNFPTALLLAAAATAHQEPHWASVTMPVMLFNEGSATEDRPANSLTTGSAAILAAELVREARASHLKEENALEVALAASVTRIKISNIKYRLYKIQASVAV